MFIVEIAHSFDEIVISLQMNYVYLCIANLGENGFSRFILRNVHYNEEDFSYRIGYWLHHTQSRGDRR